MNVHNHIIYFVNPLIKDIGIIQSLKIIFQDSQKLFITQDLPEALNFIQNEQHILAAITNYPEFKFFQLLRSLHPNCSNVLITEYPINQYSAMLQNNEHILLDNIIYKTAESQKVVEELIISLNKIITNDIFGIEKYLNPHTQVYSQLISDSQSRAFYNYEVMKYCENLGLGSNLSKAVFGIVEELLMNAIYDAPYKDGVYYYHELSRNNVIKLQPHERPVLSYACDGKIFAISCKDPFGSFKKEVFFTYLKKVIKRSQGEDLIDKKAAGAGLGLFKVLYSSHKLICNLDPLKQTEIISIIDLEESLKDFSKMGRSVHFFMLRPS